MRAQELSLTTVVVATLAIIFIIFIFAVIFNIGNLGIYLTNLLSGQTQGMARATFQQRCELLCTYAINFNPDADQKPDFCCEVADTSDDGGIAHDHCYDDGAGTDVVKHCVVNDAEGTSRTLNTYCTTDNSEDNPKGNPWSCPT